MGLALPSVRVLPDPDLNLDEAGDKQQFLMLYRAVMIGPAAGLGSRMSLWHLRGST